jgi:energy-coupling factor transporter ATP-binding protein EcfA2
VRGARAEDWWRRLYHRPPKLELREAEFSDLPGVGRGSLKPEGILTALCGTNGAGKTRIMRAIASLISSADALHSEEAKRRLLGSSVRLRFRRGEAEFTVEGKPGEGLGSWPEGVEPLEVLWIDPHLHCLRLAEVLGALEDRDDFLRQLEPNELSEEQRRLLSYVVGREYERVRVWESEEDPRLVPLPYFSVVWRGIEYGAEDMGLGELCAHYIFWAIDRLKTEALIFLEEPEAFLLPMSQTNLMNYLAKAACERGHCVLLTTHSGAVLNRIPHQHVRVIRRVEGGVEIPASRNRVQSLRPLGLEYHKQGVLLTEDEVAKLVAESIISCVEPDLAAVVCVEACGDKEKVMRIVNEWPVRAQILTAIGLLDGDARGEKDFGDRLLFLPGNGAPEEYLRAALRANVVRVEDVLNTEAGKLEAADHSLEGRDLHEWLDELAAQLGVRREVLIHAIVAADAADADRRKAMQQLVGRIEELLQPE